MRSCVAAIVLLGTLTLSGCGGSKPDPELVADPAETFAEGVRMETMAFVETVQGDPASAAEEAEILLESLEDTSTAGEHAAVIDQIKAKAKEIAGGSGDPMELVPLAEQLPGEAKVGE